MVKKSCKKVINYERWMSKTTGKSVSPEDGSAGYAAGLMIAAGLVTLIYVSIKEFRGER
ncbi:hypothetical protein [Candidatus Pyrohabitans sp.]